MFCYAYICEPEAILNPALQIMKRPREQAEFQPELEEEKNRLNDRAKAGEISGEEARNEGETLQSSLGQEEDAQVIPLTDTAPVESVTYTGESGDAIQLSPISLLVDLENQAVVREEDGVRFEAEARPEKAEIRYRDGSSYVVYDNEENIDNTGNVCGDARGHVTVIAFNRLVDVDQVESITVNDEMFCAAAH